MNQVVALLKVTNEKLDNIGHQQSVQVDAAGANAPTVNIIHTCSDDLIHQEENPQPRITNADDPQFIPKSWEYRLRKKGDSCIKYYP